MLQFNDLLQRKTYEKKIPHRWSAKESLAPEKGTARNLLSVGFERRILDDNLIVQIFLECRAIRQEKKLINKKQQQPQSRVAYVTGEEINEHAQRLYKPESQTSSSPSGPWVTSPAVAQTRALPH